MARARGSSRRNSLPLLKNYWAYDKCGYDKTSRTCSEPDRRDDCTVPTHRLRNGRLNQTAYSLYFFIRDIARCDLPGWIDNLLPSGVRSRRQKKRRRISRPCTYPTPLDQHIRSSGVVLFWEWFCQNGRGQFPVWKEVRATRALKELN